MRIDTLTIVGVGLLGGSIGLAARARGVARRVIGIGRDNAKLEAARASGVIHEVADGIAAGVRETDLVVFCTPVDRIAEQVLDAAPHCRPGTVLTDVGSTKANIMTALAAKLTEGVEFVGSHPMAGAEKAGAEFARADLFENRVAVVTPAICYSLTAVRTVTRFWEALGARVVLMPAEEHDRAVAATSHLPHAVAAALAGGLPAGLFPLAATGFRDATRIAAGDPDLWAAIFRANRPAVLAALGQFAERLGEFRRLLDADDGPGLVRFLSEGKQVRDALGD